MGKYKTTLPSVYFSEETEIFSFAEMPSCFKRIESKKHRSVFFHVLDGSIFLSATSSVALHY